MLMLRSAVQREHERGAAGLFVGFIFAAASFVFDSVELTDDGLLELVRHSTDATFAHFDRFGRVVFRVVLVDRVIKRLVRVRVLLFLLSLQNRDHFVHLLSSEIVCNAFIARFTRTLELKIVRRDEFQSLGAKRQERVRRVGLFRLGADERRDGIASQLVHVMPNRKNREPARGATRGVILGKARRAFEVVNFFHL